MSERPANADMTPQRARAVRTVKLLALVAFGFYLAVILNGVLHR